MKTNPFRVSKLPKHFTKHSPLAAALGALVGLPGIVFGHDLRSGGEHPRYDWSVKPPEFFVAQADTLQNRTRIGDRVVRTNRPAQAAAFDAFAPRVTVRWDERFLFVESNGLPAHNMMVGITAWQQQVPLPQNYTGANAWRIPLSPVPAKEPLSIKNRFLRGAIALAANGIPIFNPQNNRGELSAEIGELDKWGGHCGRADDYHYHAAPLHLQTILGNEQPIAYALDGYPIYGLTEPDGSEPAGLDAFNGHTTTALGYHYHASNKYPYVNGGFHGVVVERDGQVDPQPRANGVREALPGLRGAKITDFESTGPASYKLTYNLNGEKRAVLYTIAADGTYPFEFQNGREGTVKEIYSQQRRGGGSRGGPPPSGGDRRAPDRRDAPPPGEKRGSEIPPGAAPQQGNLFVLSSPDVVDGGALPVEFTGDGNASTLPLSWCGAPAGTTSYALIMHHVDPEGRTKWYWTLYNIPATIQSLPKNSKGIGTLGTNSINDRTEYAPPRSKGPGAKTYVLTLYALSDTPRITTAPSRVDRDTLLAAMTDRILGTAELRVVYSREGSGGGGGRAEANATQGRPKDPPPADRPPPDPNRLPGGGPRPPRSENRSGPPPQSQAPQPAAPDAQVSESLGGPGAKGGPGSGKGKPDNKGLIKPNIADTMKLNVYADNWFVLYVNGRLVAVDPIQFTPHNVVSVDFLPEYPMTIAVLAKDNADPKTGLEYGTNIGDGGFILKFGDGTVTNATWKAKSFFTGPLNHDTANPKVEHTPIPDKWWAVGFDDSKWANAIEYTEERINPKQPFFEADFKGAKFIWTADLDLDNTIIFRTRIERPDWKQRWNTKPDLDVSGPPFK